MEECAGVFWNNAQEFFGRMRGCFLEECAGIFWKNARMFFGRMRGNFLEECADVFGRLRSTQEVPRYACLVHNFKLSNYRFSDVAKWECAFSTIRRCAGRIFLISFNTFFRMCRVWLRIVGDGAEWDVSFWEIAQKQEIKKIKPKRKSEKGRTQKISQLCLWKSIFFMNSLTWAAVYSSKINLYAL